MATKWPRNLIPDGKNAQPWEPEFQYRCLRYGRHVIGSDHPLGSCPVIVRGSPCQGALERFGKGSRGPRTNGKGNH